MKRSDSDGSVLLLALTVLILVLVGIAAWQVYLGVQRQGAIYTAVSRFLSSYSTGDAVLSGTVSMGPAQPTCSSSQSCTTPLSNHTIQAIDISGDVAATAQTDANGHYSLSLQPGAYVLTISPSAGIGLTAKKVVVHPGNNTFDFSVDTGLR